MSDKLREENPMVNFEKQTTHASKQNLESNHQANKTF
jgi:hypothetical protein